MPGSNLSRKSVMEHRCGARHRVNLPVEIQWRNGHKTSGTVCDLSRGGMFVTSEDLPRVNGCIDIGVVTQRKKQAVHFPGLVIHHCGNGFGLCFRELNGSARSFLAKCLR